MNEAGVSLAPPEEEKPAPSCNVGDTSGAAMGYSVAFRGTAAR
jgi:hypothetical protein